METTDKERAKEQAQAQLDSIKEMIRAVKDAESKDDEDLREDAYQIIAEDPLSVSIKKHYEILLCWGGPACRIIGELGAHSETETATIQYQDWFTPWIDYPLSNDDEEIMLEYARHFYFEE